MSTAGKVLVVLIMLVAIGCMLLGGGVAQLNHNANERLEKLSEDLEKTQASLETTKKDIINYRDQTTIAQEKIDREIAALQAQQADLERTRTQVSDTLSRLQYDLSTVNGTIAAAKESLRIRVAEFDADTKAMEDLRRGVQALRADNAQLMARLASLRKQFQDTHHKNLETVSHRR